MIRHPALAGFFMSGDDLRVRWTGRPDFGSNKAKRSMKRILFVVLLGWPMAVPAQLIFYDRYLGTLVPAYPSTLLAPCSPWCNYETRNRVQERRKARFDSLRTETPPTTPPEAFGMPRANVAPTPESDIQPEYRASGRVREEFGNRSKVLPQFEEPVTPVTKTGKDTSVEQAAAPSVAPPKRRATPMLPCPKAAPEC